MAALAMRLSSPALLVDIAHIGELKGIEVGGGTVRIGALTRHVELQTSPIVAEQIPLLAAAVPHIAHHAIRTRGTRRAIGTRGTRRTVSTGRARRARWRD